MMKKALLLVFVLITCCPQPHARAAAPHAQMELLSEDDVVVPGTSFRLAIRFRIEPEWHLYWKNPGDSGQAPVFQWEVPPGVSLIEVLWPFPERIDDSSGTAYGYREEAVLIARFQSTERLYREAAIGVKAQWVACSTTCVSESAEAKVVLPVDDASTPKDAELFSKADLRIPYKNPHWTFGASIDGKKLYLGIAPPPDRTVPESLLFFPEDPELFAHGAQQELAPSGAGAELAMTLSDIGGKLPERVKGVLVSDVAWEEWDTRPALEVDAPVESIEDVSGAPPLESEAVDEPLEAGVAAQP